MTCYKVAVVKRSYTIFIRPFFYISESEKNAAGFKALQRTKSEIVNIYDVFARCSDDQYFKQGQKLHIETFFKIRIWK